MRFIHCNIFRLNLILTVFILLCPCFQVHAQQNQNVYRNTDNAFSIVFPNGWSISGGQTPHTAAVAENNKGASIVLQVWQLPQEISYDQYADQDLRQMARESFDDLKKERFPDAVLENYSMTYLSNKKALKTVFRHPLRTPDGIFQIRTIMISVLGNKRMVQILCSAPVSYFNTVETIFQRSYGSFLFEDPSWYQYK